jgi:hypothetical protein
MNCHHLQSYTKMSIQVAMGNEGKRVKIGHGERREERGGGSTMAPCGRVVV